MSPISLILTVGTGTAGRDSFVAQGLRTTVEILRPRRFWLVPSSSPASIEVADYVRDGLEAFVPWTDSEPYRQIEEFDSLQACRLAIREVIRVARARLDPGERLIVNPTSGTKQMSSGATIAALDENVGELVFTVGERVDGVVKTGTERLETFKAGEYFAERDFALAQSLFASGAFASAARVLKPYRHLAAEHALCTLIHEWERSNYRNALAIAKRSAHPAFPNLLEHLKPLAAESSRGGRPSLYVTADLLGLAKRLFDRKEHEAALLTACKALEVGVRCELLDLTGLHEPYRLADLEQLPGVPSNQLRRFRANATSGGVVRLGLRAVVDLLASQDSVLAEAYLGSRPVKDSISIRNDRTHQIRAVERAEAHTALREIRGLLAPLPPPPPPRLPPPLETPAAREVGKTTHA